MNKYRIETERNLTEMKIVKNKLNSLLQSKYNNVEDLKLVAKYFLVYLEVSCSIVSKYINMRRSI